MLLYISASAVAAVYAYMYANNTLIINSLYKSIAYNHSSNDPGSTNFFSKIKHLERDVFQKVASTVPFLVWKGTFNGPFFGGISEQADSL